MLPWRDVYYFPDPREVRITGPTSSRGEFVCRRESLGRYMPSEREQIPTSFYYKHEGSTKVTRSVKGGMCCMMCTIPCRIRSTAFGHFGESKLNISLFRSVKMRIFHTTKNVTSPTSDKNLNVEDKNKNNGMATGRNTRF